MVGGAVGLVIALVRAAEKAGAWDILPPCGTASALLCEAIADNSWSALSSLLGVVGFAVVAAVGAVAAGGTVLPRRVGLGVQALVATGAVFAHWLVLHNLLVGMLCYYCVAACVLTIPLFTYTTVHAYSGGWLRVPEYLRSVALTVVDHRRAIVVCWCLGLLALVFLGSDWYERNPAEDGALGAVALISAATVLGALVASRFSNRMGLWLSLASAMMMVTALTDVIPDVWHDSEEAGTPLWIPGLALAAGFVVVTYFTRGGCGHGHDGEEEKPSNGRHREGTTGSPTAAFGGVGAAAALTLHRVIEGATLALTPSVPVISALVVHSASEGLALAALFQQTRKSMVPWLIISVAGPAAGVILASVSPLPETAIPVLLALVGGVLLRTALVGLKLAAAKRRAGELRNWHIGASVVAASVLGALTLMAH